LLTLKEAHPNLEFIQGDYTGDYPEPDSVDVVVCNQVYEHVPDPEALIGFIHRILKPGGYAYFAGPNLLFPIEPHVFWPFVHWLPRRFSVRLMKLCGAKYVVDANSVSIWKLRHWLREFKINNAMPTLVRHADHYGRTGLFWRILSIIPHIILDHLTIFSPGFVFVLHKRT
jgi:SAM-dependent methyltransferase